MATLTKRLLSGSTDGLPIKVAATVLGSATTIHTAVTGTVSLDEIWVYAVNTDTTDRKLTVCWGGVTDPDHLFEETIPAESGLVCVVPGLLLQNAKVVKAICATANVVLLGGYVNRIDYT